MAKKEKQELQEENCYEECKSCENETQAAVGSKEICRESETEENNTLTEALQAAEEANDKYLRLAAEYDNFKRRTRDEKAAVYRDSKADVVLELLPVMDNFERALSAEADEKNNTLAAFAKGVEMIYKQLGEVFDKLGVKAIEAAGKQFDPDIHNAVMHIQDESVGENIIVEELVKGYSIDEKVIRPSVVKVAN